MLLLGMYSIFYVGNALSPSSYGIVLNQIGAESNGLMWGSARSIRSDEYAVVTPLMQATVRNNFERYNKTSPYKEDLRATYSLPLKDWSMFFKPTILGFHLLPPAYALSLHYFLIMSLFLIGYSILFCKLGATNATGICLAILLYFSSFTQTWWTTIGSIIAFFPWVYIAFTCDKPLKIKIPLFYYLTTCMVFSLFYPILFYTLAFAMILFLLAFHRSFLSSKNVIIFGLCALMALGTYLFYIQDSVLPLLNTVYPGNRRSSGGDVTTMQWLSQFFPSMNMNISTETAFDKNSNICDISSVGSYLLLLMLAFGRWKEWFHGINRYEARSLLCLLLGFIFISIWQLFSFPETLAKLTMLDRVAGSRWFFASGFILIGIAVIILKRLEFIFTMPRQVIILVIFTYVGLLSEIHYDIGILVYENFVIIIPIFVFFLINHLYKIDKKYHRNAIISVAVFSNALVFGLFNPLQSTKPIFDIPQTSFVKSLRDKSNFIPEDFFVSTKLFGATANGLGLPAIDHVLYVPQLKFFRCYFPDMPEAEFNFIFNRYLHLQIGEGVDKPINLQSDASLIPIKSLLYNKNPEQLHSCLQENGYLD